MAALAVAKEELRLYSAPSLRSLLLGNGFCPYGTSIAPDSSAAAMLIAEIAI